MAPKESVNVDPQDQNLHGEGRPSEEIGGLIFFLSNTPAWLVSAAVHTVLLLMLALLTVGAAPAYQDIVISGTQFPDEEIFPDDPSDDFPEINVDITEINSDIPVNTDTELIPGIHFTLESAAFGLQDAPDIPPEEIGRFSYESVVIDSGARVGTQGKGEPGGFGNRTGVFIGPRGNGPGGPTPKTQLAVARGLKWIAEHQYGDGSWNFDHTHAPACRGKCGNPGDCRQATSGATAIALLPFLGCGITHKDGKTHKENVRRGLYYLCHRMKPDKQGGDLRGSFHEEGGTMYSHGLAAICLTEAYGMTKDKTLQAPAQAAVNFIVTAQDPSGGGWRYQPGQRGDTSVVGWQLMALKSGHMAYLKVPSGTAVKAMRFLDSVQMNSGSHYGYTDPGEGGACTAIGLLCRMVYGWKRDNPALERGVEWLAARGPSAGDMYYNYYATQVMHHYGGALWRNWNTAMSDQLVETQITDKNSHAFGSWYTSGGGDHGDERGGRLYKTALSVMTLEVYYRYSPIYKPSVLDGGMPLE